MMSVDLKRAVAAALKGDWTTAHEIAQESDEQTACWIHAVLHKIEGDEGNSRYWYARARKRYEDFADSTSELKAIAKFLENKSLENQ
ncbi:MAG TPA: hypothetical protein VGC12_02400 [Methyloradius sp.]